MRFAIIDIETTGGSLKETKITEIALYLHDGENIIDTYATLINPESPIPPYISRLTGITDEMVQNSPKFYEIAKKIIELTSDTVFVAHNVGFDYGIVRKEFKSLGYDYRRPHLCTVRTARYLMPGHVSYSLGKLSLALGIELKHRHRAAGDAQATAVLFGMLFQLSKDQLKGFIQQEINPKTLHPGLALSTIDELPSKTGVYLFHNAEGQIIYIGKSKNIRSRVMQHLKNNTTKKGIQMKEEITKITFELTGSELIALLRESELIKAQLPKYNRRLIKSKNNVGLFDYIDQNGYMHYYLQHVSKASGQPYTTFENKKEAGTYLEKYADKYHLCKKMMGLYPTESACFGFHIKQCYGACVGKETPELYNERAMAFLHFLSYDSDSFFVVEKGRDKNELALVLVESGCYKGFGFVNGRDEDQNIDTWKQKVQIKEENRDAKRIIQAYIRKNSSLNIRRFDPFS